ncbi:MAG: ATP synthase F0 subunit B [Desulfobacteraceae bacterium]|jgi:F-type H+-transporting ATPase subunit b
MKLKHISWFQSFIGILVFLLGLWALDIWAADFGASSQIIDDTYFSRLIHYLKTNYSRATWDLTMRWVNFLILAGVIVKYAKGPVISFLKGKQAETARSIELIEEKKRQAEEKIKERQIQLKASQERLKLIRDRIVSEGQRQKEQMIAAAKQESQIMLESARAKIDSQIRDAYQTVREELIDMAVDKAMVKLPQMMTAKDHQEVIGLWMEEAHR